MKRVIFYALPIITATACHINANGPLTINGVHVVPTSKAFAKNALHTGLCASIMAGSAWIIKQENLPVDNPTVRLGIKAGAGVLGTLAACSVTANIAQKYKHLDNISRAKRLHTACVTRENAGGSFNPDTEPTHQAWGEFIEELKPYTKKICARNRIDLLKKQIESAKEDDNFSIANWQDELNEIAELQQNGELDKDWFRNNVSNMADDAAKTMAKEPYFKHQAWAAFAGIFTGAVSVATTCYKMGLFSRLWNKVA